MIKNLFFVMFVLFAMITFGCQIENSEPYSSGPNCTKGKPCGNTCISRDKTCRKFHLDDEGNDYLFSSDELEFEELNEFSYEEF